MAWFRCLGWAPEAVYHWQPFGFIDVESTDEEQEWMRLLIHQWARSFIDHLWCSGQLFFAASKPREKRIKGPAVFIVLWYWLLYKWGLSDAGISLSLPLESSSQCYMQVKMCWKHLIKSTCPSDTQMCFHKDSDSLLCLVRSVIGYAVICHNLISPAHLYSPLYTNCIRMFELFL